MVDGGQEARANCKGGLSSYVDVDLIHHGQGGRTAMATVPGFRVRIIVGRQGVKTWRKLVTWNTLRVSR